MTAFRLILIYGFVLITLRAAEQDETVVDLSPKYAFPNIVLQCNVKRTNMDQYSVYLYCPFGVNQICYKNCISAYKEKEYLPMIKKCSMNSTTSSVQVEWTIDTKLVNSTGEWRCVYANIHSKTVTVVGDQVNSAEKTTDRPLSSLSTESSFPDPVQTVTVPHLVTQIPLNVAKNNDFFREKSNEFWVFITSPNTVLILIFVFTLSLLFNIIFLIRCSLLRSIIDQYMQSNKISDSCFYRFFCIHVTEAVPSPMNPKSIPQSNPSNQFIGYHREDIYDDMSASSQADRHLINNYSQYELEQESLLARKFWTADGSQTLFARPTQFYQGAPPMSNYVIVSGPVCSARNPAAFISGTNTSVLSNSQLVSLNDERMSRSSRGSNPKNESSSACNESIIYSQPIKSRQESNGLTTNDTAKHSEIRTPPSPPVRGCGDAQCYLSSNGCLENAKQSVPMKNVDLIEHCTHSSVRNSPQENLS